MSSYYSTATAADVLVNISPNLIQAIGGVDYISTLTYTYTTTDASAGTTFVATSTDIGFSLSSSVISYSTDFIWVTIAPRFDPKNPPVPTGSLPYCTATGPPGWTTTTTVTSTTTHYTPSSSSSGSAKLGAAQTPLVAATAGLSVLWVVTLIVAALLWRKVRALKEGGYAGVGSVGSAQVPTASEVGDPEVKPIASAEPPPPPSRVRKQIPTANS